MKILIFGGSGMLGHRLAYQLSSHHTVGVTFRGNAEEFLAYPFYTDCTLFPSVDIHSLAAVEYVLNEWKPDVVINAVGIIKQLDAAKNAELSIGVNALFPHQLARLCKEKRARLIHISTDCVFSGNKMYPYTEEDISDVMDLYGRTKSLGEVSYPHTLTLRTSIIGPELTPGPSLLSWFLRQQGLAIRGFTRALYSGVTTLTLARIIDRVITEHPNLHGLYQVASTGISKYDLLCHIKEKLGLDITIIPDDTLVCDRRMSGDLFTRTTDIITPSWEEMISELKEALPTYSHYNLSALAPALP